MQVVSARDITEQSQAQEALQIRENSRRKQSQTLVQLARSKTFQQGNLNAVLREITETAAQTLLVERVGVWLYDEERSKIECIDLYDVSTKEHIFGNSLLKTNYPVYFQALEEERTIAVDDARNDTRTQELSESYLSALGITSLLDAPIWLEGRLVGVVCHEHIGEGRQWTLEEETFAGSIADFVTLAIEASERNVVQEALRQSEAQFRAIFERSSIGIGLINMKAQIVDTNLALRDILGYSREELYGKPFTDYISTEREDLKLYKQLISGIHTDLQKTSRVGCQPLNHQEQLVERHRIEMERRCLHQNGSLVWTHISVSVIPGSNGEPEFFLAMIEDITERKQTELKLRASQEAAEAASRAKSEFLATMSHELRTPLNVIMGLSQLLQQEIVGSLNEKQNEYVNCIYSSGEHLLALINDILDLSKVEAGKEELLLSPLPVSDLCNYAIWTVRDRALEKGLQLTHEIDLEADICVADERRIKQMLLNLLSNAIKFTPAGQVSLVVKKVPQGITFTVSDTGIGIDSNHFKFLFEPFKQLDSRLNRQYEGTGLGLALTRKLARLHGGDVTVKSTLGEGSQFTLFLPNPVDMQTGQNEGYQQDTTETSSPATPQNQIILLVEEEKNTAIVLQDYLQTIGYQVKWIDSVKNFLEQVRNLQPNLILLDVQLVGDPSACDLLNVLKQEFYFPDLQVVMMGFSELPEEKLSILQAGASDYLLKPIQVVQLESILTRYLSSSDFQSNQTLI
ncbi:MULTISPECIES: ATP-binding protein [unclassified Nostoc]|uniref:hybrid sensor histidine kinase/response regulator n=1 Tax=unclassified Nostoc TaxID=2593658 RepID=UPI002AD409A5|nr:ATP-binding protein [Nostoc sp. DedQUE03]MDZ7973892.1 PAS domain S-box protein [Nostoc sp. DedQUE03]MDZ8047477.1 PAS domain S-box protein [Nostoc sp. DedQUE02]